ncbi:MAG: aminotransferase class IV [Cyclobacteriaceae bacterium]|nr:aminotransferase class IV [Cyclobacteriaceae bacterium]
MKAIFNNEITEWDDIHLSPDNRAWKYADGLFETIALVKGKPRLLANHLQRLSAGADMLRIDTAGLLEIEQMSNHISTLAELTNMGADAKVRIYMWRNARGTYCPQGNAADVLVTIDQHSFAIKVAERTGFSNQVVNYPSMSSRFKTLSAMHYVLAGIEKIEKQLDELILLDSRGYLSEALASNIFWRVGQTYFTPPISTGCIEGVMRNHLIECFRLRGIKVCEAQLPPAGIVKADCVFTSNALGIDHIGRINDRIFDLEQLAPAIVDEIDAG